MKTGAGVCAGSNPGEFVMPVVSRIDPQRLRGAAAEAVAALKVLGNEDRLLLLCELSQGERSVSELEARLGIRQPTLSQQLSVLRAEGVVSTRRDGKRIHYQVADARLLEILAVLYRLYCPKE
jgi:DNA-binding transcriptional ArsR family regulator